MSDERNSEAAHGQNRWFETTRWTMVLTARDSESGESDRAMEELCRTYWEALYLYVRRSGYSPEDASDLTQAFFARLLDKRYINDVDREKGKFRSFLLKALNHFLADEWRRSKALKRGGQFTFVPIDTDDLEARLALEGEAGMSPDIAYDRSWAIAVFDRAMERLRNESTRSGKASVFETLKEYLSSPGEPGNYAISGARLGLSGRAVAVHVHRLRRRYGQLIYEEVSQTVADPEQVDEELQHLLQVLTG